MIATYHWATPRTYFFNRNAVGEASRIAIVGENSGKQVSLYTRENNGPWIIKSNFSYATSDPTVATWIAWNGMVGQQTITKIDGKDYTNIYFEAACELRPTKTSPLISIVIFVGSEVIGGYKGQVLTEGQGMTGITKLLAFSVDQGKLEKIPLTVRGEKTENFALYENGMKCGDFNGDGFDDIMMITSGQKLIIYLNDGTGSFDRVKTDIFPSIDGVGGIVNIYDDVDGDGIRDLLYFSATGINDTPRQVQFKLFKGLRKIFSTDK